MEIFAFSSTWKYTITFNNQKLSIHVGLIGFLEFLVQREHSIWQLITNIWIQHWCMLFSPLQLEWGACFNLCLVKPSRAIHLDKIWPLFYCWIERGLGVPKSVSKICFVRPHYILKPILTGYNITRVVRKGWNRL